MIRATKRLIARYVMRKLWDFHKDRTDNRYGDLGQKLNLISTIPTVLGGDSSWDPKEIAEEYGQRYLTSRKGASK